MAEEVKEKPKEAEAKPVEAKPKEKKAAPEAKKEESKKEVPAEKPKEKKPVEEETVHIVRVKRADLKGSQRVGAALTAIKGVGANFARAVTHAAGIPDDKKVSSLTEKDVDKLEDVIDNPAKYKIPSWMLNRQKDYDSGTDKHTTGADIAIQLREEINRMRKNRMYRGIRHELGLPARGQRTRSSFRKGVSMGVSRKKK